MKIRFGHWGYSIALLAIYLASFHLWAWLSHRWVVVSGLGAAAAAGFLLGIAGRRGYFVNGLDAVLHGVVVLDILLEAVLLESHTGFRFYGCAIGFGVVVGGYRASRLRRVA